MAASSYQKDGRLAPAKLTVAASTATTSGSSQACAGAAIRRLKYPLNTSPWCQKGADLPSGSYPAEMLIDWVRLF